MPETTPVAFRGYAGGTRMALNHAVSRFSRRALFMDPFSAFGAFACKLQSGVTGLKFAPRLR
jgi:hypothetical protein